MFEFLKVTSHNSCQTVLMFQLFTTEAQWGQIVISLLFFTFRFLFFTFPFFVFYFSVFVLNVLIFSSSFCLLVLVLVFILSFSVFVFNFLSFT